MEPDEVVIAQTKKWLQEVVIGCNFCPFAAKEVKRGSIYYQVLRSRELKTILQALAVEFQRLDEDENIETTLLVIPDNLHDFNKYLELVEFADEFLVDIGKEGVYQLASFHPFYRFAKSADDDPANYTNRSIYPMLHILREASLTAALEEFPRPERIPKNNVTFARKKGLEYMKVLRESCLKDF